MGAHQQRKADSELLEVDIARDLKKKIVKIYRSSGESISGPTPLPGGAFLFLQGPIHL
jgi:hypothetical protein